MGVNIKTVLSVHLCYLLQHKVWEEVVVAGWVLKHLEELVKCRKCGYVLRLSENVK
jgi:hypothetical protein